MNRAKGVGLLEGALSHPFRLSFTQMAEFPSLQQLYTEKSSPLPSLLPGEVVPLMWASGFLYPTVGAEPWKFSDASVDLSDAVCLTDQRRGHNSCIPHSRAACCADVSSVSHHRSHVYYFVSVGRHAVDLHAFLCTQKIEVARPSLKKSICISILRSP
jgi:hypothetical protein